MTVGRALDLALVAAVAAATALAFGDYAAPSKILWGGVLESLTALSAAAGAFSVAHSLRKVPDAFRDWLLLATGLLLFGVGEAWDIPFELPGVLREPPTPPDFLYLAGYVVVAAALVGFLRSVRRFFPVSSSRELWITVLLVALALAALGALVIRPIFERPLTTPQKLYLVGYTALDIGLLAPLALLCRVVYAFRGGPVARAWGVLLAGFVVTQAADLAFSLTPWLAGTALHWLDQVLYVAAYAVLSKGVALHRELVS